MKQWHESQLYFVFTVFRSPTPSKRCLIMKVNWKLMDYQRLVSATDNLKLMTRRLLSFYTSTKSWRGYIFTAVCLCVCLSVCVCVCPALFLWTKFQPNGYTDLDAVFAKQLHSTLARTLLKLVTLGQRSRSKQSSFFLHNSLLTFLLYISAVVCLFNLWYALCRFV